MIAGTQELQVPEFSLTSPSSHRGFWSPIRESLTRNLLGYIPEFASLTDRTVLSPPLDKSTKPVVTYVSRQSSGRRLTEDSDKSLVDALRELEAEGLCEVQIVRMENLSLKEQVRVVARSAVSFSNLLTYRFIIFLFLLAMSQYSE
jgi:protein O-GlcNAc transferase